jgi:cell wall-associated NlpC family hydrolase
MSKKALIIAAIVFLLLLLLGGVAILVLLNARSANNTTTNTTTNTETNTTNNTTNPNTNDSNNAGIAAEASINDFLASGENKKCTYVDGTDSGTMYFAYGNMRADFVSAEGNGSMIITESKQYIWDDAEKAGVMFNVDTTDDTTSTEDYGGMDVNQNFQFNCSNWSVDASMFMPPSDVTMTDFSELFNY